MTIERPSAASELPACPRSLLGRRSRPSCRASSRSIHRRRTPAASWHRPSYKGGTSLVMEPGAIRTAWRVADQAASRFLGLRRAGPAACPAVGRRPHMLQSSALESLTSAFSAEKAEGTVAGRTPCRFNRKASRTRWRIVDNRCRRQDGAGGAPTVDRRATGAGSFTTNDLTMRTRRWVVYDHLVAGPSAVGSKASDAGAPTAARRPLRPRIVYNDRGARLPVTAATAAYRRRRVPRSVPDHRHRHQQARAGDHPLVRTRPRCQ